MDDLERAITEAGWTATPLTNMGICTLFGHRWKWSNEYPLGYWPCVRAPHACYTCDMCGVSEWSTPLHVWVTYECQSTWDVWKRLSPGWKGCGWCGLMVKTWEEAKASEMSIPDRVKLRRMVLEGGIPFREAINRFWPYSRGNGGVEEDAT